MRQRILVTGGAGFVGSWMTLHLRREFPDVDVIAFDNLRRRGSELNLSRLKASGVRFVHGDVRVASDLAQCPPCELIVDCCAEPSVLAGVEGQSEYVLKTNLDGTFHLLEMARKWNAAFLFLSSSRVYPIPGLLGIPIREEESRFSWHDVQKEGIGTGFPMKGHRSLYGFTKLASELLIEEYAALHGVRCLINRCGVLAGPGQFGKVDQGFMTLWVSAHVFGRPLKTIGYGGSGKQVRDVLHPQDLMRLVSLQMSDVRQWGGDIFHAGGGLSNTVSLKELTGICESVCSRSTQITPSAEDRPMDVPVLYLDNAATTARYGWHPEIGVRQIAEEIQTWLLSDEETLRSIL